MTAPVPTPTAPAATRYELVALGGWRCSILPATLMGIVVAAKMSSAPQWLAIQDVSDRTHYVWSANIAVIEQVSP